MPDYNFTLFDTALFTNSVPSPFVLFQVAESGDATHTPYFTNMRGNGQLPNSEKFLIQSIEVYSDTDFVENDREGVWLKSYMRLLYNDVQIFSAPLRLAAGHAAFSGVGNYAAAAANPSFGLMGTGYKLEKPILIDGGKQFKVVVAQGTALNSADQWVKVALNGILSLSA